MPSMDGPQFLWAVNSGSVQVVDTLYNDSVFGHQHLIEKPPSTPPNPPATCFNASYLKDKAKIRDMILLQSLDWQIPRESP